MTALGSALLVAVLGFLLPSHASAQGAPGFAIPGPGFTQPGGGGGGFAGPGFGGPGFGGPIFGGPGGFGDPRFVGPGDDLGGPPFLGGGPVVPLQIRRFDLQGDGCPNRRSADLLMSNVGFNGLSVLRVQFNGDRFLVDGRAGDAVRDCSVRVRLDTGGVQGQGLQGIFFGLVRAEERVLFADGTGGGSMIVRSQFRVTNRNGDATSPVRSFQPGQGVGFVVGSNATRQAAQAFNTPRLLVPLDRNGRLDVLANLQIEVRPGADAALLFDSMDLILASSF